MKGFIALLGLLVLAGCAMPDVPQIGASEVHFTLSEAGGDSIAYLLSECDEYNTEMPFTTVFHTVDPNCRVQIQNPSPQRCFLQITRFQVYSSYAYGPSSQLSDVRYSAMLTGDAYEIRACLLSDSTVIATRTVWILRDRPFA